MQQENGKLDLVQLAELIKYTTQEFDKTKFKMFKKERKVKRKSINRLIEQYNDTIGKKIIPKI